MTRSALITRTSARFLGFAGLALLFAADEVLPIVAPGFSAPFAVRSEMPRLLAVDACGIYVWGSSIETPCDAP